MDKYTAAEEGFKRGYEKGYEAGKPKWIPVSERLPDKDGSYLVFKKNVYGTDTRALRFAKDGRKVDKYDFHTEWKNVWYRYDIEWGYITIDDITHWMPLPEPPKEDE